MDVSHNDPDYFIEDPEYFSQYCCWLLNEHKRTNIQTNVKHIGNAQLGGGSNWNMSNEITMFTYIRPVKWNVHILNGSKYSAKGFGFAIINIPKTIISLYHSVLVI